MRLWTRIRPRSSSFCESPIFALKAVEGFTMRIAELENENRQQPAQMIANRVEKSPAVNPPPIRPEPQPKPSR